MADNPQHLQSMMCIGQGADSEPCDKPYTAPIIHLRINGQGAFHSTAYLLTLMCVLSAAIRVTLKHRQHHIFGNVSTVPRTIGTGNCNIGQHHGLCMRDVAAVSPGCGLVCTCVATSLTMYPDYIWTMQSTDDECLLTQVAGSKLVCLGNDLDGYISCLPASLVHCGGMAPQ